MIIWKLRGTNSENRKSNAIEGNMLTLRETDMVRLLVNLEMMKAGYPPVDIRFTNRVAYYKAFDEYQAKHKLDAMEKLFAGYVNERLDSYLGMLKE